MEWHLEILFPDFFFQSFLSTQQFVNLLWTLKHLFFHSGVLLHLSNPRSLKTSTPGLFSSRQSSTGLQYASCSVLWEGFSSTPTGAGSAKMGSSFSSSWPSSHATLQQTVALVIKRSSGFRECIHLGRKSQFWSLVGRWRGLQVCITFMVVMKMVIPRKGPPTPAITRQPAKERPSTIDGKTKKQRSRYKTANQRYLAVRSPRTRAIFMGKRMKGIGYHSRIPKMLKKRWQRAI